MSKRIKVRASLVALILLGMFLFSVRANAQECPEGYRCVPEQIAEGWLEVLEHQLCMDRAIQGPSADFQLEMQPLTIFETKEGQIFTDDKLKLDLRWCSYEVEMHIEPNFQVQVREEEEAPFGFRLRIRLGISVFGPAIFDGNYEVTQPSLLLEPFYFYGFHPAVFVSSQSFGAVLGFDLTRNWDVYFGYGAAFKNPSKHGFVLGTSLSFN